MSDSFVLPRDGSSQIDSVVIDSLLPGWEGDESRCDIYRSYAGTHQMRFDGFLVTGKGDINQLVAYCPLAPGAERDRSTLLKEVARQFRIATRIADDPQSAEEAIDAIGLVHAGTAMRPVPYWVFSLRCLPLLRRPNEKYLYPRPFCPAMFEAMASQPKAIAWLREWQAAQQG
jgi:hypothetical protein